MKTKPKKKQPKKSGCAAGASCKMSASLATLLTAVSAKKKTVLAPAPMALGAAARAEAQQGEPSVLVFFRSVPNCSKSSIAGVPLSGGKGPVRTALVPIKKIGAFAAAKEIQRVSAPRQMRPLMDVGRPLVRVPQFRQTTDSSGAGVIVGIVDSGIDVDHPAFAGRILSVWDQNRYPMERDPVLVFRNSGRS